MEAFVNISDHWKGEVENRTDAIREEILKGMESGILDTKGLWKADYHEYVSSENANEWRTLIFKFFGIDRKEAHQEFPIISDALKLIPNLISAEVSFLFPGVRIAKHVGYSKMILRNHLPLIVPKGDLGIRIEDQTHVWQEGKLVSFNDSLEHEAWNLTEKVRIVLMFDIAQPGSKYSVKEICQYKLENLSDPTLLEYGSSEVWLRWFGQGYFS